MRQVSRDRAARNGQTYMEIADFLVFLVRFCLHVNTDSRQHGSKLVSSPKRPRVPSLVSTEQLWPGFDTALDAFLVLQHARISPGERRLDKRHSCLTRSISLSELAHSFFQPQQTSSRASINMKDISVFRTVSKTGASKRCCAGSVATPCTLVCFQVNGPTID